MTPDVHDWLTLHRVRLNAPREGARNPMPGPKGARCWRFYPDTPDGPTAVWGGFAVHASRAAAEACLSDAALPFGAGIAEGWHALAVPFRHHGAVFWHDRITTDAAFALAPADPGGPLAVLTTGGFDPAPPVVLAPRLAEFARRVEEVRRDFAARPGVRRIAIFHGEEVDGREGFTMTLWDDLAAMTDGAYGPGVHKVHMDHHRKVERQSDRSSFTRLRILASAGSWDDTPA